LLIKAHDEFAVHWLSLNVTRESSDDSLKQHYRLTDDRFYNDQ